MPGTHCKETYIHIE